MLSAVVGSKTLVRAREYRRKSLYFSENARPWRNLRVRWEFFKRESYIASPFYGPILRGLREGRIIIEPGVSIMAGCWLTAARDGRIVIGRGTFVNLGVFIAAYEQVTIGENCLFANHCYVSDADHRFDDPTLPLYDQGFRIKGPTTIGNSVWFGVNVAVMGGVTIGDHCVIGANSVVTSDLEPYSIAVGAPARVIGTVPRAD